VHENDRLGLERLCGYGARGPLTLERLSRREDGTLEYQLKRPLAGGATTLVMTPVQLLKRLCALAVKPRVHLTRYFGVFAPHANARGDVVPSQVGLARTVGAALRDDEPMHGGKEQSEARHRAAESSGAGPQREAPGENDRPLLVRVGGAHHGRSAGAEKAKGVPERPRLDWAALLRRTFGFDVFECSCGGRRLVLAVISSPEVARKILGLSGTTARRDRPPSTAPPQLALALR
jgi:hypothetical protein